MLLYRSGTWYIHSSSLKSWHVFFFPGGESTKTPMKMNGWNMSSWSFGRWFSFRNGWFLGSILVFQGVYIKMIPPNRFLWMFRGFYQSYADISHQHSHNSIQQKRVKLKWAPHEALCEVFPLWRFPSETSPVQNCSSIITQMVRKKNSYKWRNWGPYKCPYK